jgi:diapolycopene oxygenase
MKPSTNAILCCGYIDFEELFIVKIVPSPVKNDHKKAIIVGAGIAGIAAAIRLRAQGLEVEVFEANDYPGGKLTAFEQDGFRFDAGPSLFTMPALVDELFVLMGEVPHDHFRYMRLNHTCHYFWNDGQSFEAPADPEEFVVTAAKTFQESETALRRHMRKAKWLYDKTHFIFLERSLHRLRNYLSLRVLKSFAQLWRMDLLKTMHSANQKRLKNPKLVQLFDRFATYNGSNPYRAPGILNIIPALEHHFGTYLPEGGMHDITTSLFELAKRHNVIFHFGQKVERIVTGKRVQGVSVNGQLHDADLVVSNMDVVPTYRKLLPHESAPERALNQERSSSAIIFYWGIRGAFPQLDLHNIFFSDHYREEFDFIFRKNALHPDPTVYVNITSKYITGDAPEGSENWFVMINAPGNKGQDWDSLVEEARGNIIRKLNILLNCDLEELIATERVLDPRGIELNTSSYQGSLYGSASNARMAAIFRHPNFNVSIPGLYFCGGSVHPGGGIPLCLNSARIVAEEVKRKQA